MKTNRPTLKTVAEEAKVSLPTVSQVMRGVGRISDDTRKKVLAAADTVGYVTDHRAASVRTGRSQEVAIIVHDIANHFNAEVIHAVSKVLEAEGYFLSIMDAQGDPARLEKLVRIVLSKTCAGLLWVPSARVDPSLIRLIEKQGMPSVTFIRHLKYANLPFMGVANFDATKRATEYLISLGHKRIAFAGGQDFNQTRLARIDGYRSAMGSVPQLVLDEVDSKAGGFKFAQALLSEFNDITGVICNGDEFAIGLCLGLQRLGKAPGRDISVIGFDNIDEAALLTPSLTTLSISPVNFGNQLGLQMLNTIADPSRAPFQGMIEAELIIRDSTGRAN